MVFCQPRTCVFVSLRECGEQGWGPSRGSKLKKKPKKLFQKILILEMLEWKRPPSEKAPQNNSRFMPKKQFFHPKYDLVSHFQTMFYHQLFLHIYAPQKKFVDVQPPYKTTGQELKSLTGGGAGCMGSRQRRGADLSQKCKGTRAFFRCCDGSKGWIPDQD